MIFDKWDNLSSLHFSTQWDEIMSQVQILRQEELKEGRYELCHDAYLNIMSFHGKKESAYESHKKFVDVHFVIKGSERIDIVFVSDIEMEQTDSEACFYQEDKDVIFYTKKYAPRACVYLDDTNFLLAMPNDAHAPCLCSDFGQCAKVKTDDTLNVNENFEHNKNLEKGENLRKGEKNLKGIIKIPTEWAHKMKK